MPWKPDRRTGWSKTEEKATTRFTQVLRTILEVVPGGVIRYKKTAYSDDTNVGFWLGVDDDGLAKFNLGGATYYLKWSGTELLVSGAVRGGSLAWGAGKGLLDDSGMAYAEDVSNYLDLTPTTGGNDMTVIASNRPNTLHVINSNAGNALLAQQTYSPGTPWVTPYGVVGTSDVSNGIGVRGYGRQAGVEGAGSGAGSYGVLAVGDSAGYSLRISGAHVHGGSKRYTNLADATAATDAMNRQSGDARYLQQSAGWSGSFQATVGGVAVTVAVVNGQITSVA